MRSIQGRRGWLRHSIAFAAAVVVAAVQFFSSPVFAAYELPPGERITNLPAIPRNMPQKEAYENYDPVIGRNFDLKNLWIRGDMRVRPEWRNGVCFGGSPVNGFGGCNAGVRGSGTGGQGPGANNSFVQQWARLGIGYDLSPDVNFYVELIYSHDWGTTANPANAGQAGGPALNNNCGQAGANGAAGCGLGVRAAYMLVRNLGDVQGLSLKAGRQYLVFGNHSLLGHFDWANTGFSHDGFMLNYSGNKNIETWLGWFREADLNIGEAASTGSFNNCGGVANVACQSKQQAQMVVFYNQIKSIPGFLIEPHYILWQSGLASATGAGPGLAAAATSNVGVWVPKSANQVRHTIGNRTEMRKGNFDFINELEYQFGTMASGQAVGTNGATTQDVHINAWATRNWLGYTHYQSKWKPRFAVGFDYASGDGNANCNAPVVAGTGAANYRCTTGNTFENLYPTNHIHMGYMDVMAWKNMLTPSANIQFRPSARDHFEIWYNNFNLASARDNWYRGSQTVYVFSKSNNTAKHIGDEVDFTWTRMFADGKVALQTTYGYMWTGDYIKQNLGNSSNQQWAYVSLWVNF
ncbi:alginate export family protein [Nitrospira sp. Nam74]